MQGGGADRLLGVIDRGNTYEFTNVKSLVVVSLGVGVPSLPVTNLVPIVSPQLVLVIV